MEKMSVTRGLSELKTITKRIQGAITGTNFLAVARGDSDKTYDNQNKNQFASEVKSSFDSIDALIERWHKIKTAIIKSNSDTLVNFNNKQITVSDCIEKKKSVESKKTLRDILKGQLVSIDRSVKDANKKVEESLERVLQAQSIGADKKSTSLDEFIALYRKMNCFDIFDPIGVKTKIKEIEEEISKFESEIDFVLSESNAKTFIEI